VFIELSTNSLQESFINKLHQESHLSSNGSASRQQSLFVADGNIQADFS